MMTIEQPTTTIACGNHKVHGKPRPQQHHESVAQVRECFATTGGILSLEEQALVDMTAQHVEEFLADAQIDWDAAEATPKPKIKARGKAEPKPEVVDRFDLIPDGVYTIEHDSLRQGYRTVKVRTQDKDDEFAPGKRLVGFLSGPDNDGQYTNFAFLNGTDVAVWKRFRDNVDLMAVAALMSTGDPRTWLSAGHCWVCHRTLTTPESIAAGIGPKCAERA